jgi:hypothetical protein
VNPITQQHSVAILAVEGPLSEAAPGTEDAGAMLALLAYIGVPVVAGVLVARWVRRRLQTMNDYHERESQDPPVHGWTLGGGPGGVG